MDGVAEGIENRRNFPIDACFVPPDVAHGERYEFRKSAGAVYAYPLSVGAEVTPAGQAIAAAAAHDVAFSTDDFAWMKIVHIRTNFNDLADKLMADCHRHGNGSARPFVPFVNMQVGTADAGVRDADEDVVDADGGFRNVEQSETGRGVRFDKSFHTSYSKTA